MLTRRSGEVKKTEDDDDEENLVPKGKGVEKEERVRIYEGIKEQLLGSDIKTTGAPLIHFEVQRIVLKTFFVSDNVKPC